MCAFNRHPLFGAVQWSLRSYFLVSTQREIAVGAGTEKMTNRLDIKLLMTNWISIAPFLLVVFYSAFLWFDITKPLAIVALTENNVVELLTFGTLLVGSVIGVRLSMQLRQSGAEVFVWVFYGLFSICLFIIAMEEIAWGQWFFGFETPEELKAINRQGELTFHNIEIWHDYIEALPLIYGLGGMLGIYLGRWQFFSRVAPSILLLSWFAIIVGFSLLDLIHEFKVFNVRLMHYVDHLDELMELFVGISSLLYVELARRRLILKSNVI
jgi:hypothetical protein